MSRENVKLFYDALVRDKSLQEEFKALSKKYEGQKSDEKQAELIYQKELIPMARKMGFEFTPAELKEYAGEAKKPTMRELSEEELAAVAGGQPCVCVLIGGGNFYGDKMICGGWGYIEGEVDGRNYYCICPGAGGGGWT